MRWAIPSSYNGPSNANCLIYFRFRANRRHGRTRSWLDPVENDPSLPFGINFAALHIIEFYFHDLRISDHGPIAAAGCGVACNFPTLLGCSA